MMSNKDVHSLPVLTDDNLKAYLHEVERAPLYQEIVLLSRDHLLYRMILFTIAALSKNDEYSLLDLNNIRMGAVLSYGALHFQEKADSFNASLDGSQQSGLPRFSCEGFEELTRRPSLSEIQVWLARISSDNPNLLRIVEEELVRTGDDYKVDSDRQLSMRYFGCVCTYAGLTRSLRSVRMLSDAVLNACLEQMFVV